MKPLLTSLNIYLKLAFISGLESSQSDWKMNIRSLITFFLAIQSFICLCYTMIESKHILQLIETLSIAGIFATVSESHLLSK